MSHVGKYTYNRPMDVIGVIVISAKGQSESFFLFDQVLVLKKRWGTEASLAKTTEAAKPHAIHGTGIFANI